MHKRLINFLDRYNCLYSQQFGFRSNHSTSSALINCTEKIRKALDSGNHVCSVFIDLQKAFDTVDHDILFSKLYFYGVRGVALNWFKSFLTQRSQTVSVSGIKSSSKPILHGVPQGSVLGPLLFLIYVNDLHEAIPFSLTNLFADDTMLFNQSKSLKSLAKMINIDLKCLNNWLNANMISLNSKNLSFFYSIHLVNHHRLNSKLRSMVEDYIPVTQSNILASSLILVLNWGPHIDSVCKKLSRANGMLSKIRNYVSRDVLLSLYYALFHSHLSYATNVWALNANSTKRILNLQKKAVRLMTFSDFDAHSLPLFTQLRMLSFHDFTKFTNIIFTFNLLNYNLPAPLYDTFHLHDMTHLNLRRPRRAKTGLLRLPKVTTVRFGNHSLSYQAVLKKSIFKTIYKIWTLLNLNCLSNILLNP